jgi:hypothetical protein
MMSCQPAQHEADGGEEDEGDGAVREVLEILGEAPTAIEPGDGALDDPALGQELEARTIAAFDDLELPVRDGAEDLFELGALIGAVADDLLKKRKQSPHRLEQGRRAVAVLHVGRMHLHAQQQAERVDEEMALLALDLLAGVIARRIDLRPPFSAPLTLCESMMATVGLASRPSHSRSSMYSV